MSNDPYTAWVNRERGIRSRGGEARADYTNYSLGELRALFVQMPLDELASQWVALVADAVALDPGFKLGSLVRALVVVAQRLHDADFDGRPVAAIPPAHGEHTMSYDGFTVKTDAPLPQPKGRARLDNDPLNQAISNLEAGQHIEVQKGKIKKATLQQRVNSIKKRMSRKDIAMYEAIDGTLVVRCTRPIRQAAAEQPARSVINSNGNDDAARRANEARWLREAQEKLEQKFTRVGQRLRLSVLSNNNPREEEAIRTIVERDDRYTMQRSNTQGKPYEIVRVK